mmetsp:Transcript_35075/g.91797  ORF Transcript_35075/g.91797 Transcript_35075/m.91797 type:complete len:209 (-) Transcript_35075:465-1091(-)
MQSKPSHKIVRWYDSKANTKAQHTDAQPRREVVLLPSHPRRRGHNQVPQTREHAPEPHQQTLVSAPGGVVDPAYHRCWQCVSNTSSSEYKTDQGHGVMQRGCTQEGLKRWVQDAQRSGHGTGCQKRKQDVDPEPAHTGLLVRRTWQGWQHSSVDRAEHQLRQPESHEGQRVPSPVLAPTQSKQPSAGNRTEDEGGPHDGLQHSRCGAD